MGGLISAISSWISGKQEVRVLILGLDSAGKTTILYRLSLDQAVTQVAPTVAFNLETVEVGNLKLNIWDLGGQIQLRPFWRLYYKDTNGIVFVIDSADRERIDICAEQLNALLGEEEIKGVPIVVMANKQDLPNAMKADELTQRLGLINIKDRAWSIIPSSALKGEGIKDAFEWLSQTMETKK